MTKPKSELAGLTLLDKLRKRLSMTGREWTLAFNSILQDGGILIGKPEDYEVEEHIEYVHVAEKTDRAEIDLALMKCVEALQYVMPYIEQGIPQPSHKGSCTPETSCDMDCHNAFHGANAFYAAENALAELSRALDKTEAGDAKA